MAAPRGEGDAPRLPYRDGRVQELKAAAGAALGLGIVYWLIAACALAAAFYYPKPPKFKALAAGLVVFLFSLLPAKFAFDAYAHSRYAQEAWAHFRKLCAEKSGEKVYKSFTGVKSILVLKPLPPASDKDHFDQFWYGDPYSGTATPERGLRAASILTLASRRGGQRQEGFEFVEIGPELLKVAGYQRISSDSRGAYARIEIERPESRFGVLWEDISTPEDRAYWVAGSRLRVVDRADNEIVAERIGFLIEAGFGSRAGARRPWQVSRHSRTTCPPLDWSDVYADQVFLTKVLKPDGR
jgi:hypothetical protein